MCRWSGAKCCGRCCEAHRQEHAAASMATAVLDDPTGYGGSCATRRASLSEIVEQIDCTPEQREIREVFPSYYCVQVEDLLWALGKLKNDNKKGEYYLTDIYGHLRQRRQEGAGGAGGDGRGCAGRPTRGSSWPMSMRSCRTAFSGSCARAA